MGFNENCDFVAGGMIHEKSPVSVGKDSGVLKIPGLNELSISEPLPSKPVPF